MDSISTTMGQEKDSPGASSSDHGPVFASESTGAVEGSSAKQACLVPGRSGQPPWQIQIPRYGVAAGAKLTLIASPALGRSSTHQFSAAASGPAKSLSPMPVSGPSATLKSVVPPLASAAT